MVSSWDSWVFDIQGKELQVFSHIILPRAAKAGTLPCRKTARDDEFVLKSLKPPIESRSQDFMYL